MNKTSAFELSLEGITRVYPGVVALNKVALRIRAGEVVGLIGENGAGKSTLMKILGGVISPTSGTIYVDGIGYKSLSVAQSQAAGIAFVHQELNVFENLDVASNIFLGRENRFASNSLIDQRSMSAAVAPILERLGSPFAPDTMVSELSIAQQQLLEIAKALSMDSRLVIMDEPTSSLTISETNTLLDVVAELKQHGVAVIFISHRLSEVEKCVDRIVVLRDGNNAGEAVQPEVKHNAMIRMMIGRDLKAIHTPSSIGRGASLLRVENARTAANPNCVASFNVFKGEILGVSGLIGAGRTELVEAIFGAGGFLEGKVEVCGVAIGCSRPQEAIDAGLYLIPEDRKRTGLVLDFSVADNITLANLAEFSKAGLVDNAAQIVAAEVQREALAIKTPSVRNTAQDMSGGNQQKVVLAKWLSMNPKVIIFDEPTRGIDVGAKAEIYKLMRSLSDQGVGIVVISSDMEEVVGVSDRIVVMADGSIQGELARSEFSETNILSLAMGNVLEDH